MQTLKKIFFRQSRTKRALKNAAGVKVYGASRSVVLPQDIQDLQSKLKKEALWHPKIVHQRRERKFLILRR